MRQYSKWEKFQNWFYYHKLWVFVGAVICWVVGSMLWNVLGIGQTAPDYRFVYVGSRQLPEDCVQALEAGLATLGEDLNGDGTVTVSLAQCVSTSDADPENMLYGYGSQVTLLADITDADSHFFLMEDPQEVQLSFQILADARGNAPADEDFSVEGKVFRWENCPRLASLELGAYEDAYLDRLETGACQDLLSGLYLGRRYYYDASEEAYPQGNEQLWLAMTEGATP